jgi:hypothetical protein
MRASNFKTSTDIYKYRISPPGINNRENFTPVTTQPPTTSNTSNMSNMSNTTNTSNKNSVPSNSFSKPGKKNSDPDVFGPPLWFTLHNSSAYYPENASPVVVERMKGFILGLPYMIPCPECASHASQYIEENLDNLEVFTSGREMLFAFFCDFHNYVNTRLGKRVVSLEEAKKMFYP